MRASLLATPLLRSTTWPLLMITKSRDGLNPELLGESRALVDIYFRNRCLVAEFFRELSEDWFHLFAGATPFGPEVDEHRPSGLVHFEFEVARVELFDFLFFSLHRFIFLVLVGVMGRKVYSSL